MKQYLTPEQTAKLFDLGFVPKTKIKEERVVLYEVTIVHDCNFTIDELIEILPENSSKRIRYVATKRAWVVDVDVLGKSGCAKCCRGVYHAELIDALYDMAIKLKENGVI